MAFGPTPVLQPHVGTVGGFVGHPLGYPLLTGYESPSHLIGYTSPPPGHFTSSDYQESDYPHGYNVVIPLSAGHTNTHVPITMTAGYATMNVPATVPIVHPMGQIHHSKVGSTEWYDYILYMAHQKYNSSDYQGALVLLQDLYGLNPIHLPTLLLLGCTCYSLSLFPLSIYYNNLILQLEPNYAEAYSNLGTTHRALALFLEKNPNAVDLIHQQNSALPTDPRSNYELSERCYRIAVNMRPYYWDAVINLAGLLSSQCRWKEALNVNEELEELMESEFPHDQRLDTCHLSSLTTTPDKIEMDGYFMQILSIMEGKRRKEAMMIKSTGKPVPGEVLGYTIERRRDLYYAKGNLYFTMNDGLNARQEYLKALIVVGIDVSFFFEDWKTAVLPLPSITPQQALFHAQQKQMSDPSYHPITSSILQTLAKIYQDMSFPILAIRFYYLSLSLYPTANTCNNLGILLASQRIEESIQWYQVGLTLDPNHVHLYTNLGSALKDRGQVESGIQCYQRAITLQPDFFVALANLANVFKDLGRVDEAIGLYKRALQVKPDFVEAFCNYVNSLLFICDWENRDDHLDQIKKIADKQLRESCVMVPKGVPTVLPFHTFTYSSVPLWMIREISSRNAQRVLWNVATSDWFPGFPQRPSKVFMTSHHALQTRNDINAVISRASSLVSSQESSALSLHGSFDEYAKMMVENPLWASHITRSLNYPYPYALPPPPSPYIHIGYVSSDFTNHPLAHLMQSVFKMHDRTKFRVYCYALTPSDGSAYRHTIESGSDVFVDVSQWSLQHIVERIARVDHIHILVNLNGYTKGGRNEIFAARPAPIQVSMMGFAGTMGAGDVFDPDPLLKSGESFGGGFFGGLERRWMDYLVSDEIASPQMFVVGEPLESDEEPTESAMGLIESGVRGRVVKNTDSNRMYSEGMIYMPFTYFVNDHRQGFRELDEPGLDSILDRFDGVYSILNGSKRIKKNGYGLLDSLEMGVPENQDSELDPVQSKIWKREQIRRLKMRQELFPNLPEETVIFANFNQLYKVDPVIFETWMKILKRLPNSVLWLLRFPAPGEAHLRKKAIELVGEDVAQRLLFTDVAPKNVHIHRGRVADVFLDTVECNAHTTAADILWSGTPIITFPKYDFKMCSRVSASIAYATGEWSDFDPISHTKGLDLDLNRLRNPRLLGHEMVVNSYQEYEDRAVFFGRSMVWGWSPIPTWLNHDLDLVPPISAPPSRTSTPNASPSRDPTLVLYPRANPTHILVPFGFVASLRKRLFLTREEMPLFDTPKWVRHLESGFSFAMDKWMRDWQAQALRNQTELETLRVDEPIDVESRCIWVSDS